MSTPSPASAASHEHAWGTLRFELDDGHPVVRQRCTACGSERRYRAWERYWTPAPQATSGSPRSTGTQDARPTA